MNTDFGDILALIGVCTLSMAIVLAIKYAVVLGEYHLADGEVSIFGTEYQIIKVEEQTHGTNTNRH